MRRFLDQTFLCGRIARICLVLGCLLGLFLGLSSFGPDLEPSLHPSETVRLSSVDGPGLLIPGDLDRPLMTAAQASLVSQAVLKTPFQATGFGFCSILNGAWFDGSVVLKPWGGSVAALNPDVSAFLNLLDYRAAQVQKAILQKHYMASSIDAKRMACYSVAMGNYAFVNLTQDQLLISLDPVVYMSPVLPAIRLDLELPRQRPAFKLAYLIMIHEHKGFPQLAKLLENLDDGDAIVLVHVDARSHSSSLMDLVKEWIQKRRMSPRGGNVHLAQNRYKNIWGHASLVFTQLSGFWELKDLADWDYVINLSNYDWPLKSNAQIHQLLLSDGKGKNYIEYWSQTGDFFTSYNASSLIIFCYRRPHGTTLSPAHA